MKKFSNQRSLTVPTLSLLLGGLVVSSVAFAREGRPGGGHGTDHGRSPRERIQQGVRSGELTREEAQKLRQKQQDIRKARQEAAQDGEVTPEERAKIRDMRKQATQAISNAKHNDERRPRSKRPAPPSSEPKAGASETGADQTTPVNPPETSD